MATWGSLSSLFEKRPTAENLTLMDPLASWTPSKTMHPPGQHVIPEIFGELQFEEKPGHHAAAVSPLPPLASGKVTSVAALERKIVSFDRPKTPGARGVLGGAAEFPVGKLQTQIFGKLVGADGQVLSPADSKNPVFPPGNSETLQFCTEGLGFESSDDLDVSNGGSGIDWSAAATGDEEEGTGGRGHSPVAGPSPKGFFSDVRARAGFGEFPPPISVISSSGKPCVSFRGYKADGRFVLMKVRTPTHELLQASREDGRLKLHVMQTEDAAEEETELEGADAGEEEEQQSQERDGEAKGA